MGLLLLEKILLKYTGKVALSVKLNFSSSPVDLSIRSVTTSLLLTTMAGPLLSANFMELGHRGWIHVTFSKCKLGNMTRGFWSGETLTTSIEKYSFVFLLECFIDRPAFSDAYNGYFIKAQDLLLGNMKTIKNSHKVEFFLWYC